MNGIEVQSISLDAGERDSGEGSSGLISKKTPEDGSDAGASGQEGRSAEEGSSGQAFRQEGDEALERSANISVEGKWLSLSDLMLDSYPAKSKLVYLKSYKLFERYLKANDQWTPNAVPTEIQVMNYFHHLRNVQKFAPTTLWSTYARINAVLKRLHGVSLNSYTRVSEVLKSYDSGHVVKQAGIFTPQQIEDFVTDPELSSKYWLVRKVVCLVGYYGGFRNIELKSLKFENCELDEMGYWFRFNRSKQRGRLEPTSVCVPRRQPDWIPVRSDSSRIGLDFDPASVIDLYLAEIQSDFQCSREELEGDFFRATHGMKGQKFTRLTLGKNTIGKVGIQVATELCLARPETYTGHCWRRSCGTSASDSGVNVTTLMALMGWSNPKTAMVYVKKSRMTSLSLALYLANVQRSNLSNPFPRSPLEKREVVRQSKTCDKVSVSGEVSRLEKSESELKSELDADILLGTQDLLREIEAEEMDGGVGGSGEIEKSSADVGQIESVLAAVSSASSGGQVGSEKKSAAVSVEMGNQMACADPRMTSFLQNLQNSGNITINFNFDRK